MQSWLYMLAAAAFILVALPAAHAQFSTSMPKTTVKYAAPLKPPPGARVAIVEFDDLQCPECARANPLLMAAAAKYKIPWIRHDFPLPYHTWNKEAAIDARWFDTKSKALGNEFRNEVFAHQSNFYYNTNLFRKYVQKFAQQHGITMPFVVDPTGKLAAEVNADYELGQRIGINHTPTIWIVTSGSTGPPYVEVTDLSKLYQIIDQAIADTSSPVKSASK